MLLHLRLTQSRGVDVETAKREGMEEMAATFKAAGAQVYLPAEDA